ncbi:RNA polymerase sigma factor [Streptomyces sp. NBC_00059]|uniref:RNA polymerase sigma factor n=1 Tax=Streptomyces sp. NBC_00059 TaxID=2975635 RepID=UPI0022591E1D|nr:sigma-70 family RNA polymerase sigma factor [Streptomyces sp. NBC_00059]MCX5416849.1 sigma-70 family RNA polymerase sigma factor [Streptomyces sp. NBC_00059]
MSEPSTGPRPGAPGNRWELIWSHRDELLEIARSRSSSAEEAEDAVQEAMIRAVEDPGVPYGRIRPWLRHATVRACADRQRQIARDRELGASLSAAPAASSLVEDEACDRAEARWLAGRTAELLPARQAQALRLQAQHLDVGQVARTMGLSYRATESLLSRARRSLRDTLAGSLALATAAWLCARRFPRTGTVRSAGATTAAVTLAVAGAVLPAGPFDRPDGPPPCSRSEALPPAAPAAEFPASRAARERPHPAFPSTDRQHTGRERQEPSRSVPEKPSDTYDPPGRVVVEISIGSASPVPELPPVVTPTSIPELPVDIPDVSRPELPSVRTDVPGTGLGVTVDLP